jgi:hypothetical protein
MILRAAVSSLLLLSLSFGSSISLAIGTAALYSGSNQNTIVFFDGYKIINWPAGADNMDKNSPQLAKNLWPGLPTYLDAATFNGSNKYLFFKRDKYWSWDIHSKQLDLSSGNNISNGFPGLPNNLDAAVFVPYEISKRANKIYFFRSSEYWRWDVTNNKMDPGYPKSLEDGWPGLPISINMAVYGGAMKNAIDSKLYLFRGNRYWRWDLKTDEMDKGYPRFVDKYWPGLR